MPALNGTWSEVTVGAHPCDVFEPRKPHPQGHVAIYLHGVNLNRLVDKVPFGEALAKHGLRVVAPMTGRCWWTNRRCSDFDLRFTPERHLLDNVLPFVRDRFKREPPNVALFGTSMGGQGALRFALKNPSMFPVAAAISPAIDYHTRIREGDEFLREMYGDEETARQDTATLHVHPLNWPRNLFFCCDPADTRWMESSERLHSKLGSLGIPHEVDFETTGGGHSFDYYGRMADKVVRFLIERLERERLRVA